jgi:hypothetical protein
VDAEEEGRCGVHCILPLAVAPECVANLSEQLGSIL